jgi:4-amino-4-deoxy-L-arabinose transferase-like glycosyltransferase
VNWDEFFFLSHVYASVRGDLGLFLQGAHVHAFRWITGTGGDEVDQIVRLRLVMCVLLAISAALLYALARLWASRPAALVAVFAFLATWPVLKHGASFRADALILPLTLAAFHFTLRVRGQPWRNAAIAGACIGLAFVVTVKSVLLLPALVAAALLPDATRRGTPAPALAAAVPRLALAFGIAAVLAAALLALHSTTLVAAAEPAGAFAARAFAATMIDIPFAPRREYLVRLVAMDLVFWFGTLAGILVAARLRAWSAAALALSLVPLLFYRNAFPYYYPVMMAPAAVLLAIAAEKLLNGQSPRARGPAFVVLAAAVCALLAGAYDSLMTLRFNEQASQRAIVAAVHRIFPEPVPYLDHSGMIASFPKVNFFMSTWGVEAYVRAGRDFMPDALAGHCPPLLLVDHPVLSRGTLLYRQLSKSDRQLLETRYVDYWGPVRVAGAMIDLAGDAPHILRVPCTGTYRVEANGFVLLDGRVLVTGDTLALEGERDYRVEVDGATSPARSLRLVWAGARAPPAEPPPKPGLYSPL